MLAVGSRGDLVISERNNNNNNNNDDWWTLKMMALRPSTVRKIVPIDTASRSKIFVFSTPYRFYYLVRSSMYVSFSIDFYDSTFLVPPCHITLSSGLHVQFAT